MKEFLLRKYRTDCKLYHLETSRVLAIKLQKNKLQYCGSNKRNALLYVPHQILFGKRKFVSTWHVNDNTECGTHCAYRKMHIKLAET